MRKKYQQLKRTSANKSTKSKVLRLKSHELSRLALHLIQNIFRLMIWSRRLILFLMQKEMLRLQLQAGEQGSLRSRSGRSHFTCFTEQGNKTRYHCGHISRSNSLYVHIHRVITSKAAAHW